MPRVALSFLVLVPLAACVSQPTATLTKEVFVEPFKESEVELERLNRVIPFPLVPEDQPRACSIDRPFEGESQRNDRVGVMTAEEGEKPQDPRQQERPPTALVFPERSDARATSACYRGHCLFLDRSGTRFIHHVRLLVVNRERERVTVPVASFTVLGDKGDRGGPVKLDLLVAATDRAVKIPESMVVPPGEQRLAHFFYSEKARLSPILEVRWSALVADPKAGLDKEIVFRGDLVRRYVCQNAPLSPLEDRVRRGLLDLPDPGGTRNDWIDPGLSAVPGVGR
jgi:hypothetical protein